jgi:5-dehydro-2-deoxygluconokinase
MQISTNRPLDIILAGRAGIDLNTMQINRPFAAVDSFTKSVGGSPANIAQGTARLGLKTGFIGKVAGDGMGDYIVKTFKSAGIDVTGIIADQTGALNCLAITEIISPTQSGSYLYRERTADLLLAPAEISEAYIKSASAVLLSGTAFSQSPSREAMFTIIEYARRNGTLVILDIDFRPYGWQSPAETANCYSQAAAKCDVIIGNREEFNAVEYLAMPDNRDNQRSAAAFLAQGAQLVIVKDGPHGSSAYTADGQVIHCGVIPVKAIKTFGSGDAYAAGLLYGLVKNLPLREAMELGTACAAMVLTSVSCADALPAFDQVRAFQQSNPVAPYQAPDGTPDITPDVTSDGEPGGAAL